MKTIIVTIDTAGSAQVEVNGMAGKSCEDLTRELEQALGTVTDRKRTADYHKREVDHAQQAGR